METATKQRVVIATSNARKQDNEKCVYIFVNLVAICSLNWV